jgi:hypothetical protein
VKFEPKQVIQHALTEANAALARDDWEDLLGHIDVAQHWVKVARAHEQEHVA